MLQTQGRHSHRRESVPSDCGHFPTLGVVHKNVAQNRYDKMDPLLMIVSVYGGLRGDRSISL